MPAPTPVSVAIEALGSTIDEAIQQSKIITTLDEQISKALGLLVDLILLPFLPILVGGIIQLYTAIIKFGTEWDSLVKAVKEKGLEAILELVIKGTWDAIESWWSTLMDFLFGSDDEKSASKKKFVDAIFTFFDDLSKVLIPVALFVAIMKAVLGEEKLKVLETSVKLFWEELDKLIDKLIKFVFGMGDTTNDSVELGINTDNFFSGVSSLIESILKFIFGDVASVNNTIDFAINLTKLDSSNPLWGIVEAGGSLVGGAVDFASGLFGGKLQGAASGGYVRESGLAVIHKGETITPAGSGGLTVNITGTLFKDEEDMYRNVMDRVRADLWRQNV